MFASSPPAFGNETSERLLEQGQDLLEEDDISEAISLLEQALIADPADPHVRFWLGRGYWRNDETRKAQRAFDQAIAIEPSLQDALYWGGRADLRMEDRDAAEEKHALLERLCDACAQAQELRAELDRPEEEQFLDLFADESDSGETQ